MISYPLQYEELLRRYNASFVAAKCRMESAQDTLNEAQREAARARNALLDAQARLEDEKKKLEAVQGMTCKEAVDMYYSIHHRYPV